MKISEANVQKYEQARKEKAELFNYEDTEDLMDENIQALERKSFIQEHPGVAVVTSMALLGTSVGGMLATSSTASADMLPDGALDATIASAEDGSSDTTEESETMSKVVTVSVSGPGHIEAVDNCIVDGNKVTFTDVEQNAAFRLVGNTDTVTSEASVNGVSIETSNNVVVLEAHTDYSKVKVTFAEDPAVIAEQERAAAEAEAAAAAAAAQRLAEEQAAAEAAQQVYVEETYEAAPVYEEAPAPTETIQETAPVVQEGTPTPFSGAAAHQMSRTELNTAHRIFDAYNDYRASKGLNRVEWSDDCANMAYGSVTGCAARGTLVHRLGIPAHLQYNYSDILQYNSAKSSAQQIVTSWINSTGHRKMMQCETATVAGVAAFNNGGVWIYAIVYNFDAYSAGGNQDGN